MLMAQAVGNQDVRRTLRRCGKRGGCACGDRKKGDTVLEWCGGSAPEGGGEVEDPGFCEAHVGDEKGSATEGEGGLRSQDANRSSTSDEARQNSPGEAID